MKEREPDWDLFLSNIGHKKLLLKDIDLLLLQIPNILILRLEQYFLEGIV